MIRAGIVGDGYTAVELIRILLRHPRVEIVQVTSLDHIGRRVSDLYPALAGFDLELTATDPACLSAKCDVVFLALPHGQSMILASELLDKGIKCIDLGADFRLSDPELYSRHYGLEHKAPHLLQEAVYGLPEINRDKIKEARLIANPGCYPTGAILALYPLLKAGIVDPERLVVDSKSGVSGAGRALKTSSLFCEVNEGISPYGVGTHRHRPEIIGVLSEQAGTKVGLMFSPHLVPMNRGILTTAYAWLKRESSKEVSQAFLDAYAGERFISLLPAGVYPHTKRVYGSNRVEIAWYVEEESGQVVVMSAIDNLTKGASGQAVQNMNIMFAIDEAEGLDLAPVWP